MCIVSMFASFVILPAGLDETKSPAILIWPGFTIAETLVRCAFVYTTALCMDTDYPVRPQNIYCCFAPLPTTYWLNAVIVLLLFFFVAALIFYFQYCLIQIIFYAFLLPFRMGA